jgi:hypothetical protein
MQTHEQTKTIKLLEKNDEIAFEFMAFSEAGSVI